MKHRIGRVCVLIATVAILFFYPFVAPPAHRIDEQHFHMIVGGMTEAEVEGIFGVPAGEYDWCVSTGSHLWVNLVGVTENGQAWNVNGVSRHRIAFIQADQGVFVHGAWNNPGFGEMKTWTGRHGSFNVVFDRHGRVASTSAGGEIRREYPWSRWWRQWKSK
jgi:hypothetical protein